EAVQELDRAIAAKPNDAGLYLARAQVRPQSDAAKRIADVDKAIALSPGNLQAYLFRADIYLAGRQIDRAVQALDAASKIAPDNLDIVRRRKYLLEDNHLY